MEINSANFKELASRFGMKMLGAFRDAFDGLVSQECENVFWRTVELGIENTMRALVEADVEDSAMVSALCEVWGLSRKEAAERVAWLKRRIAVERLKEFLLLKGKRSEAVAGNMLCKRGSAMMTACSSFGISPSSFMRSCRTWILTRDLLHAWFPAPDVRSFSPELYLSRFSCMAPEERMRLCCPPVTFASVKTSA